MAIVFICWAVLAVIFSLALFRAAARPVPRPEEEYSAQTPVLEASPAPKLQKPLPVSKPRPEVLATSYTSL